MIDYSAPIAGAINRRTKKSNQALLLISGVSPHSPAYNELLEIMDKDFVDLLPDYLQPEEVKDLKETCKQDQKRWMRDDKANDMGYNLRILRHLNQLYLRGELTWPQRTFLGCTFVKVYDWWYPTDQEVANYQKKVYANPLKLIPPLNTADEIYRSGHHVEEPLQEVLQAEQENIYHYCQKRGWPKIPIAWINEQLEVLRNLVQSSSTPSSHWDFENQLILQFRRVRAKDPTKEMSRVAFNSKPEDYLMSTRGNNYNTDHNLRTMLESLGWNDPIPTSLGSLFWYQSNNYVLKKQEGQIILPGNFDFYCSGVGKKNGGGWRMFYFTSPQVNMLGKVAAGLIIPSQEENPYCAYRDQIRGQEPLFECIEAAGIDSTEYSDHQTVTLLKFILDLYGFGSYSMILANTLQLPIRIPSGTGYKDYIPPNGSEAGGRLDVVLINDAGLVISWLAGKWLRRPLKGYICGDDWTYFFNHKLTEEEFLSLHSLCASFNQIVNPDKTEWLSRDKYIGFCKILVREQDGHLEPASGLPVNLWLKEPTSIRDIAQIGTFLRKSRTFDYLYSDQSLQQEMLIRLTDLWREEIENAEKIFRSGSSFDLRKACAIQIPLSYGGLLLDEEQVNYSVLLNGILNGVGRLVKEYKRLPTKIATFIRNTGIEGPFAEYLSNEMIVPLKDLISLIRDMYTVSKQMKRDGSYDISLLRSILKRFQSLSEDFVTNSDGKSRVSTKDRSTTKRDGDCFLDGYADNTNCRVFDLDKKLSLDDLILLDDLEANPDLTSMQKILAFEAIRSVYLDLKDQNYIQEYSGYGKSWGKFYSAIKYNGRWIRLNEVQQDVPTEKANFLPVESIRDKDPAVYDFVIQCRRLLGRGKLGRSVGELKMSLLQDLLRFNKEEHPYGIRRLDPPDEQKLSPQARRDRADTLEEMINELD